MTRPRGFPRGLGALSVYVDLTDILRRDAQVRAEILPRDDGAHTLRLILDDDKGNIMTLDLLTVSEEQAGRLAEKFRTHPERLYDSILQVLLETEEEG